MVSNRIKKLKPSLIVKYNDYLREREQKGITFIKANIGQPDFKTSSEYYEAFKELDVGITNGYIEPQGLLVLRTKVANFYNQNIGINKYHENNIVITQGASDALMKTLYTICDLEDEIIVLEPFFSDYKIYADIIGIKLKQVDYRKVDNHLLMKKLTHKTKGILFSVPNNPDGNILSQKQISCILKFAKENDLYIISDEVYSGFIFDNEYFVSLSKFGYSKIVVVDSASKKFNVCGSRIGFVITKNKKIIDGVVSLNDSRISISYSEQYAVAKVFDQATSIIDESRKKYNHRLKIMTSLLDKYHIKFCSPKGGMSLLIELPLLNSEDYVLWVINHYAYDNQSFLVTPAIDFFNHKRKKNLIRVSLTMDEEKIKRFILMLNDSYIKYLKDGVHG